ncbi:MAG: hypothetical protein AAGH65_09695 [Pseudomonadota bacterium]
MSRRITLGLCAGWVLLTGYWLWSGHPVLLLPLLDDPAIPLGNWITAMGLVALATIGVLLLTDRKTNHSRVDAYLAGGQRGLVYLAVFWWPVGALLSGNLSNTFTPANTFQGSALAMQLFWSYTLAVVILPVVLVMVRAGLRRGYRRNQ